MFEFLKDANCVPEDNVFRQLFASITMALNSQAKLPFPQQPFYNRCGVSRLFHISQAPLMLQ